MNQQQAKLTTTTTNGQSPTPLLDRILEEGVRYKPFGTEREVHLTGRETYEAFAKPTKSGKMPTRSQLANFLKTCEAGGLDPWARDAFLVGYDTKDGPVFNTIVAHQAFLKRSEKHPAFDGMESGVIVRPIKLRNEDGSPEVLGDIDEREGDFVDLDEIVIGGWAKVYRKDRSKPAYRRSRLSVYSTNMVRWADDPGGMICKVAEADALRSSFPNVLGDMHIAEEFHAAEQHARKREPIPMPRSTDDPVADKCDADYRESSEGKATQERADARTLQEAMAADPPPVVDASDNMRDKWLLWLSEKPELYVLNNCMPDIGELEDVDKKVVWKAIQAYAKDKKWTFDKDHKVFVDA